MKNPFTPQAHWKEHREGVQTRLETLQAATCLLNHGNTTTAPKSSFSRFLTTRKNDSTDLEAETLSLSHRSASDLLTLSSTTFSSSACRAIRLFNKQGLLSSSCSTHLIFSFLIYVYISSILFPITCFNLFALICYPCST